MCILASAAAPAPCTGCRRPSWAWDTAGRMAFTHTCNASGPWSEDALDVLARFPMVTIERFMGQHERCFAKHRAQWGPPVGWLNRTHGDPSCRNLANEPACNCTTEEAPLGATADARGLFVEDHAIAALRQIKARNASVATIFYRDSARMWTNDQPSGWGRVPPQPRRLWNPTVFSADNAIASMHPEWLLRNRSGEPVYDSYQNNHVYNHADAGAVQAWVDICLRAALSGAADGCFADDASIGFDAHGMGHADWKMIATEWNTTNATARAWVAGHRQALANLSMALGNGTLIANGGRSPFANGFMMEAARPSSSMITTIQASVRDGLINQVHTDMYSAARNPDVRDALAAFLIGTGPLSFFSGPFGWQVRQDWLDPLGIVDLRQRWLPEFDKPLGEATGPGTLDGTSGVWTRAFASGTTVRFDSSSSRGRIEWADGTVSQGPGCVGDHCTQCMPPLYERGRQEDGTGGCNCDAVDCGSYRACSCAPPGLANN